MTANSTLFEFLRRVLHRHRWYPSYDTDVCEKCGAIRRWET